MTLFNFIRQLFVGHTADDEDLKSVRVAARQDAQLVVGAYVAEFNDEADRIFAEFRGVFTDGYCPQPQLNPPSPAAEYANNTRQQLMKIAKDQGYDYDRSITKEELITMLTQS